MSSQKNTAGVGAVFADVKRARSAACSLARE
jgi:hypothetical protein